MDDGAEIEGIGYGVRHHDACWREMNEATSLFCAGVGLLALHLTGGVSNRFHFDFILLPI